MPNNIFSILIRKIKENGQHDTYYFKTRAKDVIVDELSGKTLHDKLEDIKAQEYENGSIVSPSMLNGYINVNNNALRVYEHPQHTIAGTYTKVVVDNNGHVTSGEFEENGGGSGGITDLNEATVDIDLTTPKEKIVIGDNLKSIINKLISHVNDIKKLAFLDTIKQENMDTNLSQKIDNSLTKEMLTINTDVETSGQFVADASIIPKLKKRIAALEKVKGKEIFSNVSYVQNTEINNLSMSVNEFDYIDIIAEINMWSSSGNYKVFRMYNGFYNGDLEAYFIESPKNGYLISMPINFNGTTMRVEQSRAMSISSSGIGSGWDTGNSNVTIRKVIGYKHAEVITG